MHWSNVWRYLSDMMIHGNRHAMICVANRVTAAFILDNFDNICELWKWRFFQIRFFLPGAGFGLPTFSLPVTVCVYVCVCVCQARITKFGPEVQYTLVKIPILGGCFGVGWHWLSRSNLTFKSKLTPIWWCPHNHSPPIQVRFSTLAPKITLSPIKIPISFGRNWPSVSLLIRQSILSPNFVFIIHLHFCAYIYCGHC